MALYTKKEFAALCKQATNYLSVQIGRHKVIVENDKINSENLTNKLYLEKIYGRMDFVPTEAAKPVKSQQIPLIPPSDPDNPLTPQEAAKIAELYGNMEYVTLEKIYKFRQGEKLKSEIEKNGIDIQKKKGEVIPSELIAPVFVQHNQSFLTAFKNASEQILTEYGQIKKFTAEEMAFMRGRLTVAINEGMRSAEELTSKSISNIVKDFAAKRGVGERGNV